MKIISDSRIQEYIDCVCMQIRCKEIHEDVRAELLSHIEELVKEHVSYGVPRAEAVDKSLALMGDPATVGKQLHKTHRPRMEWGILSVIAALIGIGILATYSLGASQSVWHSSYAGTPTYYSMEELFAGKIIPFSLGICLVVFLYFFDYRKLKQFSFHLFVLTLLVMVYILFFRQDLFNQIKGYGLVARSFISASPFLFMLALAGIFTDWDWKRSGSLKKAFICFTIPSLIYLKYAPFYYNLVYLAGFMALVISSGAGIKQIKKMFAASVGLNVLLHTLWLLKSPWAINRLLASFNPYKDPYGAGYAIFQSIEAIRSAGFRGHGLASTLRTVPGVDTHLILTYIVYTLGWVIGLAIVLLAVFFITRLARVAGQVKEPYGRLLIKGLVVVFMVQFLWNILMTVGLAPLLGVSLPFISNDGLQFVVQIAMVGIILSVYRRKDMTFIESEGRKGIEA